MHAKFSKGMFVFEVEKIFGGVHCPHCNEVVRISNDIYNREEQWKEFNGFHSTNPSADDNCKAFNLLLNEKLDALKAKQVTDAEVIIWASQYKS